MQSSHQGELGGDGCAGPERHRGVRVGDHAEAEPAVIEPESGAGSYVIKTFINHCTTVSLLSDNEQADICIVVFVGP